MPVVMAVTHMDAPKPKVKSIAVPTAYPNLGIFPINVETPKSNSPQPNPVQKDAPGDSRMYQMVPAWVLSAVDGDAVCYLNLVP